MDAGNVLFPHELFVSVCFSHNNEQTTFSHPVTGRPVSEENPPLPPRLVPQGDAHFIRGLVGGPNLQKPNLDVGDTRTAQHCNTYES